MFFWQRPFSSSAITHTAFLAQGAIRSTVSFHARCVVTSPTSAPGSCVFAAPRSVVSSLSLSIFGILSSLPVLCSLLEETGRPCSHDSLFPSCTLEGPGGRGCFFPTEPGMTETLTFPPWIALPHFPENTAKCVVCYLGPMAAVAVILILTPCVAWSLWLCNVPSLDFPSSVPHPKANVF